jgi:copper resistance protein C
MRRILVAALLGCLALQRAQRAGAHAFLDHAEPRVGTTVASAPPAVTLFFTEPIEPAFSRVEVQDASGKDVDAGPPRHPAPDRLEVPLPPLAAGEYTVHWSVVSVDTHPTEGRYTFSVKEPGR